MKQYFFKIHWSLFNDYKRIKKGILLYSSTIQSNAHYDIKDAIRKVYGLDPGSDVSIDHIKRRSITQKF